MEIAHARQSCRGYDETRPVEDEKINAMEKATEKIETDMEEKAEEMKKSVKKVFKK